MKRTLVSVSLLLGLSVPYLAPAQQPATPKRQTTKLKSTKPKSTKPKSPEKKFDQAELDKKFQQAMTGVSLVGHFTDSNHPSDQLTEERYTIENVTKDKDDHWIFNVRIQYGDRDVKLPLRLPVLWAGDTAVISVTDFGVPLIGTYSARVVIYQGKYAGTWSGKRHGGHLFGKIVKNTAAPKQDDSE